MNLEFRKKADGGIVVYTYKGGFNEVLASLDGEGSIHASREALELLTKLKSQNESVQDYLKRSAKSSR